MKLKPINKKAQIEFSGAAFVAVLIGLLIIAPILIKVVVSATGGFFTAMNTTSPYAVSQGQGAVTSFLNFFDYLVIIGILVNILLMFISAYFIDTSPLFVPLYIIFSFILVLFLPNLIDAVDKVWAKFPDSSTYLQYTEFAKNHSLEISIIVIILTGIIMYAKLNSSQQRF